MDRTLSNVWCFEFEFVFVFLNVTINNCYNCSVHLIKSQSVAYNRLRTKQKVQKQKQKLDKAISYKYPPFILIIIVVQQLTNNCSILNPVLLEILVKI